MNLEELECCRTIMEEYSSEIVNQVTSFEDLKRSIKKSISKGKKDGRRQFTDIMEAANNASCIEELKLYILYKKSKDGNIWVDLGEPLNEKIENLEQIGKKIVEEAEKRNVGMKLKQSEVHMEVVRKYTGYLMWQASVLYKG